MAASNVTMIQDALLRAVEHKLSGLSPLPTSAALNAEAFFSDLPVDAFPTLDDLPLNISELNFQTMGAWWTNKLAVLESVLYGSADQDQSFARKLFYKMSPGLAASRSSNEEKRKQTRAVAVAYIGRYIALVHQKLEVAQPSNMKVSSFIFSLKQYANSPRRNILFSLRKGKEDIIGRSSRAFDHCSEHLSGISIDLPKNMWDLTAAQLAAAESPDSTLADLDPTGLWTTWINTKIIETVNFLSVEDEITHETLLRQVFDFLREDEKDFSLDVQAMLVKGCLLSFSGTVITTIIESLSILGPHASTDEVDENMKLKTYFGRLIKNIFGYQDTLSPEIRKALKAKNKGLALRHGAEETYERELKAFVNAKIIATPDIELDALLEYVYTLLYSTESYSPADINSKFWIQSLLEADMNYNGKEETLYHFYNNYEQRYFISLIYAVAEGQKLRFSMMGRMDLISQLDDRTNAFILSKMSLHTQKAKAELSQISEFSGDILDLVDQGELAPDARESVEQSFQTLQKEVMAAYGRGRWLSPAEKNQLLNNTISIAAASKETMAQFEPAQKSFIQSMADTFFRLLKGLFFASSPDELKKEWTKAVPAKTATKTTRKLTTPAVQIWFEKLYHDKQTKYKAAFGKIVASHPPAPLVLPRLAMVK